MKSEPHLREACEAAGQGHLFAAVDRLAEPERAGLLDQIAGIDLDLVRTQRELLDAEPSGEGTFAPPELFPLAAHGGDRAGEARRRGAELLAAGRVGYVLVAGGQASRLGYDGPKGTFPMGPVSGRSLFELHALRLLAARRRHDAPTPWYVMTSPQNDSATRAFFEEHELFGLPREDVTFFSQATIPAVDEEGRILLSGPGQVFCAPNGHGGSLLALRTSGALEDMRSRGIQQISYFQVDNPLARPADPLFLGLHAAAEAGMSSKVVAKRDVNERVGVLGLVEGRLGCIEYSDLPDDLRTRRDEDGQLSFRAGNIAVHALRVDFVERLTEGGLQLPWHVARKEMTVFRDGGQTTVKGAKFETFVFDALAESPASVTLEVDRALEFSPVKNAAGEDSPASSRRDLCRLFAGWVEAAGLEPPPAGPDGEPAVEVDPRLAEDRASFLGLEAPTPERRSEGHLYEPSRTP